jgi:hypothetical protein
MLFVFPDITLAHSIIRTKCMKAHTTAALTIRSGTMLTVQPRKLNGAPTPPLGNIGMVDGEAIAHVGSFFVGVGSAFGGVFAGGAIGTSDDSAGVEEGSLG